MRILDLGCGDKKVEGSVGVDICGNPDVRYNLNFFPYPFDNKSFDKIILHHSLEHLEYPFKCLDECQRIVTDDGYITITIPTKMSKYWEYPTHKWLFEFTGLRFGTIKWLPRLIKQFFGLLFPNEMEIRIRWIALTK